MSSTSQPRAQSCSEQDFHPLYSSFDASTVLLSSDKIKFRVHPIILQLASSVFSDMFNNAVDTGEPIELQETSETLKMLLDYIHPNSTYIDLGGKDFESIWALLMASEKYQVQKIIDEFRNRFLSDPYFKWYPLQAFAIASHFEWQREVLNITEDALDSTRDLFSWKTLSRMNMVHVLQLQKLGEMRRGAILNAIAETVFHYHMSEVLTLHKQGRVEGSGYKNIHETLSAHVSLELYNHASGRTMKKEFWKRSVIEQLIYSNKYLNLDMVEKMKDGIRVAMAKLPEDIYSVLIDGRCLPVHVY